MHNRGLVQAALIFAAVTLGGCSQTQVADSALAAGTGGQESGPAPSGPGAMQPPGEPGGLVGLGGQPGPANALALDASGALLAATDGGVFSFTGSAWRLQGEAALPGQATALLPTRDGVLVGVSGPQGGAFRLAGGRWQAAGSGLPAGGNGIIAFVSLPNGTVVASDGGANLYRLAPAGGKWDAFGPDSEFLRVGALAATPDGTLYAGGAARSIGYPRLKRYRGTAWQDAPESGLPDQGYVTALAAARDGSVVAAFGEAGGVYSLAPGAAAWVQEEGLPAGNYRLAEGARIVAYGDNGALERGSSGWAQLGTGLPGGVDALAVTGAGAFASSGNLVYRLEGGAWRAVSNAAQLDLVESLAVAPDGELVVGAHSRVLSRAGGTWSPLGDGPDGLVKALAVTKSGQVIAGTAGGAAGGAFTWNGSTWMPLGSGLSSDGVLALSARADGALVAGTNGSGVFLLGAGAGQWRRLDGGLDASTVIAHAVTLDGKGAPFASLSLYSAGADQPKVGVYRWDGTTWQETGGGLPSNAAMALATSPDGSILAGTKGGVFKLGGGAWARLGANLPDGYVTSVATAGDGSVLAGVSLKGAFRLEGGSWKRLPLAFFDNPNYVVAFDRGDSPLVGTTRGVFGEE